MSDLDKAAHRCIIDLTRATIDYIDECYDDLPADKLDEIYSLFCQANTVLWDAIFTRLKADKMDSDS